MERKLLLSEKFGNLDVQGAVLIIGAICCLLLALQWGGTTYTWTSARVVGLLTGSGLLSIAFGVEQWLKLEKATIPSRILLQRSVLMGSLFLFFLEMSLYIVSAKTRYTMVSSLMLGQDIYYIPFYFQAVQGVSPTKSGIRSIPLCLSQIVGVVAIGVVVTRTGHYVRSQNTV